MSLAIAISPIVNPGDSDPTETTIANMRDSELNREGTIWYAYQNHDGGHFCYGRTAFRAVGPNNELKTPTNRYSDRLALGSGWRYVLVGYVDLERRTIINEMPQLTKQKENNPVEQDATQFKSHMSAALAAGAKYCDSLIKKHPLSPNVSTLILISNLLMEMSDEADRFEETSGDLGSVAEYNTLTTRSRVHARMVALGMTQEELERKTGLKKSAIRHFECGRRRQCVKNLLIICSALECTPNDLLLSKI